MYDKNKDFFQQQFQQKKNHQTQKNNSLFSKFHTTKRESINDRKEREREK
jgi:hypothetical protein